MKKFLILNFSFLIALMAMVGCTKKPAEQKAPSDENQYINITALTPEGTELSLSDLVGQTDYVLVDFWATWCGPCKMLAPTISRIAEEKAGVVKVCKLDVDEEPELAQKYGIASIPTLKLFVNGEVVNTKIGVQPKASIEAMLP